MVFAGEVKNRLIGMNAHVNIRRFDGGPIAGWDALLQQVKGAAGVVGAAPVVDSKVIIASQLDLGRVDGIPVWGIDPATFPAVSDLTEHLRYADPEGQMRLGLLAELNKKGIVLGEYLARRLHVGPGSEVLLMTVQNLDVEAAVMDGFSPRPWSFFVTDHFESGHVPVRRQLCFYSYRRRPAHARIGRCDYRYPRPRRRHLPSA